VGASQVQQLMRFVLADLAKNSSDGRLKLLADTFTQTPIWTRAAFAEACIVPPVMAVLNKVCSAEWMQLRQSA
jgi:hypothetical protein